MYVSSAFLRSFFRFFNINLDLTGNSIRNNTQRHPFEQKEHGSFAADEEGVAWDERGRAGAEQPGLAACHAHASFQEESTIGFLTKSISPGVGALLHLPSHCQKARAGVVVTSPSCSPRRQRLKAGLRSQSGCPKRSQTLSCGNHFVESDTERTR